MVDKDRQKMLRAFSMVTTIGAQLATTIVIGYFGGRYLDHKLGTDPWLMIAGLLTGVAAGMFGIYKTVTSLWKE